MDYPQFKFPIRLPRSVEYCTQYSGLNSSVMTAVLGSIFIEGELWRRTVEGDDGKSKNGLIFEGRTNVD